MKIKQYKGTNKDEAFVILKREIYGAHWIFSKMDGWFNFREETGIVPNWSGSKPYNQERCFFFKTLDDAQVALNLIIENLEYKNHEEFIEIIKWKDVPSFNIMDYLDKRP